MEIKVVIHYLGEMLALMGALMLLPLAASVYFDGPDRQALAVSALVTTLTGFGMYL